MLVRLVSGIMALQGVVLVNEPVALKSGDSATRLGGVRDFEILISGKISDFTSLFCTCAMEK